MLVAVFAIYISANAEMAKDANTSSSTNTAQISLKSMMGKHYKVKSFVISKSIIEFEGDFCVSEYGIVMVYGDGNGNVDSFHIYQIEEIINNTQWKISGDKGVGQITIYPEYTTKNPQSILIQIRENENSQNTYILDSKPYDKPTLKQ